MNERAQRCWSDFRFTACTATNAHFKVLRFNARLKNLWSLSMVVCIANVEKLATASNDQLRCPDVDYWTNPEGEKTPHNFYLRYPPVTYAAESIYMGLYNHIFLLLMILELLSTVSSQYDGDGGSRLRETWESARQPQPWPTK